MSQKLYFGFGIHNKLENILKEHSPTRIFLVTGKASFISSGAKELIGKIINKYNFIKFHNFETNPKIEDIKKGIDLFNESKCDFIIGVGGGSVMDMAKAISLLARQKKDIKEIIKNWNSLANRKIPSVMIPTTAGTGSESTHFSTIYIGKKKYSLAHNSLIPDYAILDPTFTERLPAYITAYTGMDALCQAIESFWSVNSSEESRKYSKQAIDLILPNIIKAVNFPDKEARKNMLKGSNLAGKAINIAETTGAHAISYPITSYFNVPHGHAVALTLLYFIEFNYYVNSSNIQDRRGTKFVKDKFKELLDIIKVRTPIEAKEKFLYIMKTIRLEHNLSKLGISNDGIEIIIKKGFNLQRMKNNPRTVNKEDLKRLLRSIG
ncbi:MAG: phosphonoacetaldehyde reductase [Candidatus Odinarchaeia archaeon]